MKCLKLTVAGKLKWFPTTVTDQNGDFPYSHWLGEVSLCTLAVWPKLVSNLACLCLGLKAYSTTSALDCWVLQWMWKVRTYLTWQLSAAHSFGLDRQIEWPDSGQCLSLLVLRTLQGQLVRLRQGLSCSWHKDLSRLSPWCWGGVLWFGNVLIGGEHTMKY